METQESFLHETVFTGHRWLNVPTTFPLPREYIHSSRPSFPHYLIALDMLVKLGCRQPMRIEYWDLHGKSHLDTWSKQAPR